MLSRKKKRKREKIRKVSRQMTCFVVDDIDNLQAIWNFKGTFTIIPENKSPFWVSFSVLRFFFSVFRVFEIVCFISFQETGMKKIEKKKTENYSLKFSERDDLGVFLETVFGNGMPNVITYEFSLSPDLRTKKSFWKRYQMQPKYFVFEPHLCSLYLQLCLPGMNMFSITPYLG